MGVCFAGVDGGRTSLLCVCVVSVRSLAGARLLWRLKPKAAATARFRLRATQLTEAVPEKIGLSPPASFPLLNISGHDRRSRWGASSPLGGLSDPAIRARKSSRERRERKVASRAGARALSVDPVRLPEEAPPFEAIGSISLGWCPSRRAQGGREGWSVHTTETGPGLRTLCSIADRALSSDKQRTTRPHTRAPDSDSSSVYRIRALFDDNTLPRQG